MSWMDHDGSMQRQPSRQPKQVLQRGAAVHSSEAPRWLQWLPSPPQHSAAPERHPTGRWWDEIFQHRCCPRTWAKLSETVPGCAWIAGKVAEWLARMLIKITRKTFSAAFLMETKQKLKLNQPWRSMKHVGPKKPAASCMMRYSVFSASHRVSRPCKSFFSGFELGPLDLQFLMASQFSSNVEQRGPRMPTVSMCRSNLQDFQQLQNNFEEYVFGSI